VSWILLESHQVKDISNLPETKDQWTNHSKGRPFRRIFVSQLALSPKKDHPSIGGQGIFLKAVERSEPTSTMGQTFTKHAGHSEEDEGIPWQRDLTLEGHEGGLQRNKHTSALVSDIVQDISNDVISTLRSANVLEDVDLISLQNRLQKHANPFESINTQHKWTKLFRTQFRMVEARSVFLGNRYDQCLDAASGSMRQIKTQRYFPICAYFECD